MVYNIGTGRIDKLDVDLVFEVKSPDCDEALLLETLQPELEELFGVSNVEIGTKYTLSKKRPFSPLKKVGHNFYISDIITNEKKKYELV